MTELYRTGSPKSLVLLPPVQVSNANRYDKTRGDRDDNPESSVLMPPVRSSQIRRYDRTIQDRKSRVAASCPGE